jgi:long-chain acyl-CoA synthetase
VTSPSILISRPILRSRELTRTDSRDAQRQRSGLVERAGCSDATSLRQHFDQDHGGHHRLARKVALKIEVIGSGKTSSDCAHSGRDVSHSLQQSHRWMMRKSIKPRHRDAQYTFPPVKAIVDRFASIRRGDPQRPLIHLPATNRTLTASDLDDRCRQTREVLKSLGVEVGDLVVSAAGNRAGSIPLLLACWTIGAPVLPVDAGTPITEVLDLAKRFHASAVVMPAGAADGWSATSLDNELSVLSRDAFHQPSYRGAALLKLTSGSTGLPKAALTQEAQLMADTQHIVSTMGITASDVQLAAIPLSHAYGFGNLVMPLLLQGTAIVLRESFVPQQLPADARKYGARAFHGVPFMYRHYLAHPPVEGWPPTLTLLVSAGARLELETVQGFHERFGLKIHSFYGTSESGGITYDGADDLDGLSTVGRPFSGVTIDLRRDAAVPPGDGRIHVRSLAVCPQYVGDNEDSGELSDGGFLTGDYGHFLPDGRLVLAGRVSSFINVAGHKVQPDEVERVLRTMVGVTDARVLAATDAARGEQISAVVAGSPNLTLAAIRQHCACRLAAYKIPRTVVFVDRLPLTPRGKTDHRALNELVRAQLDLARSS